MNAQEFNEYWEQRLARDLAPFADPGTYVALQRLGSRVTAAWRCRGASLEAIFDLAPDGVIASLGRGRWAYKSFLASEPMADLRGLARMILQAHKPGTFVDTQARAPTEGGRPSSAIDLLRNTLNDPGVEGLTQIVFVTGEAGAGKTHVLRELVRQQADLYDKGQSDRLFLYINAQGRALARFNEALATELQDLRSKFTYHALASLVRCDVVVPIVDGFDELLGAAGYEDAFDSLSGFIEELDGSGRIVASARSTYYELEFVTRANTQSALGSQAWMLSPITIQPWSRSEVQQYVEHSLADHSASKREETGREVQKVFSGRNEPLAGKPFFVARTVELVTQGQTFAADSDLLDQLVTAYLERERNKLRMAERPLLTSEQLANLMKAIAEEMWNEESREIDKRTVREVAELVLVDFDLSHQAREMIVAKVPTLAVLSPVLNSGRVAFEHEVFFSYFLALRLAEFLLLGDVVLRMLLSRSQLPDEVANRAVRARSTSDGDVRAVIMQLSASAAVEDRRSGQVRQNAGLLSAAMIQERWRSSFSVSELGFRKVVFPGVRLEGRILRSKFEDVVFDRTDLSRVRIENCNGSGIVLNDVIVDPERTRLDFGSTSLGADVYSIRIVGEGAGVYDPARIREILQKCGAIATSDTHQPAIREVREEVRKLVERISRAYRRCNPIATADDTMNSIFGDPNWSRLERLLVAHQVVTLETRSTSGRPKRFLRRQFLPDQLVAGVNREAAVPESIRRFWDDLEREFPLRTK